jgi:hypothetical protein
MNGRPWADWERAYLREIYPKFPTSVVAEIFRRSVGSINNQAFAAGLQKSPEGNGWLRKGEMSPGCERAWFPKGHVPANKGLRRPGYSAGRMQETQFKKGCRTGKAAQNWKPIGTICADGEGYLRIKVREAVHGKEPFGFGNTKVWPLYNRYLWELHKGPIPPKHIVIFKDGNRANCVIENLELLSMADNARRNSMWATMPRELAEVIQLAGALKRKIRRHGGKE